MHAPTRAQSGEVARRRRRRRRRQHPRCHHHQRHQHAAEVYVVRCVSFAENLESVVHTPNWRATHCGFRWSQWLQQANICRNAPVCDLSVAYWGIMDLSVVYEGAQLIIWSLLLNIE